MPSLQEFREALLEVVQTNPGIKLSEVMGFLPTEFTMFDPTSVVEVMIKAGELLAIEHFRDPRRRVIVLLPADTNVRLITQDLYTT